MSYAANLWLYFSLLVGIIIVPGMDMLYVIGNTLAGGRRAGFAAVAGIMAGGVVHTLYGALSVGVLSAVLPRVFTVLVFAGAAYMGWIGITLLRSSIAIGRVDAARQRSSWTAFRQGAVTCLLNPKAYLFILAVFPQFIRPAYGPIWIQALVMGLMTALTQFAVYGGLALAAGHGRDALVGHPGVTIWIGRAIGALFLVMAALAFWQGWTSSAS